jgi:hypothetical protein
MHPAIAQALSAVPAELAGRAEGVIAALLGERRADPSPDAWRGSRLTGDGFPFEFGFSTADARLRFTLEPGRAATGADTRLDLAVHEIDRLSGEQVPDGVVRSLAAMQAERSLRFGAWIGCRVGERDTTYKLYAEVPPDPPSSRLFDRPVALLDRAVTPRMVSYTPATLTSEWYVRVESMEPRHLAAVLAPARQEAESSRLIDILEDAYGHRIRGRLPGPSVGVSYLTRGGPPIVTLHFYARAIWGSDARIRAGFVRIARVQGWDPGTYLDVTAPMANREDWRTYHGILSVTLSPRAEPSFAIGVRPIPC